MILTYYFPLEWKENDIPQPSVLTEEKTRSVMTIIKHLNDIYPYQITPSIKGGLILLYLNNKNLKNLEIKIYNDSSVIATITDMKDYESILLSETIINNDFTSILKEFSI